MDFPQHLGLVFVAVYQKILHLLYVDDLLAMVKREFSEIYDPKKTVYNEFDDIFQQLRKEAEARAEDIKKSKQVGKPVNNNLGKKQGQVQNGIDGGNKKKGGGESGKDGGDGDSIGNGVVQVNCKENENFTAGAFDVNKLQKLRAKGGKKVDTVVNKVVAAVEGESMMDKEEIVSSDSETDEDEEPGKDNKAAMEEALVRILTPKRSIDILRDVHAAKEQGKPYVVVFVGVNGVGKSTNLAKEQLNSYVLMHVDFRYVIDMKSMIPIFEKGYEKDPAIVAKEAIQEANQNGSDVVLVDTAGRMLKLGDLSPSPNPRLIDGVFLTKFDTR
ncbi:hypothetical protein RND71_042170 [Anisodus tanguticus]|uniref:SRP54-type proteins GTP-binding domain-containing protein n=1 Tax=Anisodus tanguticus TaxID=243964 RepID=A0AAE1QS18_9SOLA|nr:hypothetical protein RND71_042170 [Anisodus tanguticus]